MCGVIERCRCLLVLLHCYRWYTPFYELSCLAGAFREIGVRTKRINKLNWNDHLEPLNGQRSAMQELLLKWCEVNSGSTNLDGLETMRQKIKEAFAQLPGEIEIVSSRPQESISAQGELEHRKVGDLIRVTHNPQAPLRVLLAGHMDTVFDANHAFQSAHFIDDDTLNAPGAADMKGGLIVMLYALKTVMLSPFADQIGYEILINADEEIGSHGSAWALTQAASRAHFACVYEPALVDGSLAGARKGSGNFSVSIKGTTAHAGREHHLGVNAIVAGAEFITCINELSGGRTGLTVNVAKLEGGGPNNVVPDNAVVRFNVRIEQPEDGDWFMGHLEEILTRMNKQNGLQLKSHGHFYRPPKPMDEQTEKFFQAVRAVGADLNLTIKWVPTGGCCDGNNIAAAGIPVVDTLGVRGGKIHSTDEFVKLDSLEERAKLSALLLMKIAAGEIPNPGIKLNLETQ